MRASAPASAANLGPGFDALALALDIRCEVSVSAADEWALPGADEDGLLEEAATRLSDRPLRVHVESEIPVGRGLGSSAALLSALALAIARLQGDSEDPHSIFRTVAEIEEHADNAAAAVFGGCVLVGGNRVHQLELHESWSLVVAVPDVTLSTAEARRALPAAVPFDVAVRTGARAIRLVEALRTGNVELMREIGADELHEPTRIALRPLVGDLLSAGRAGGAPLVAISGSGPSVVAIVDAESSEAVEAALADAMDSGVVLRPGVARQGVR